MSYKREDFEIKRFQGGHGNWMICCSTSPGPVYLHSDGRIFTRCPEYWPAREHAEEILDKYYPEPKHVWKHGDVFVVQNFPMICLCEGTSRRVYHLTSGHMATCSMESYLKDATFLFNIKDKL